MLTSEPSFGSARSIYHAALCTHLLSRDRTKRSTLFLYLFGNRYISRRQMAHLLSYNDEKNLTEFISKFTRSGLLKRQYSDPSETMNDVFTLTKSGMDIANDYFVNEGVRLFERRDVHTGNNVLNPSEYIAGCSALLLSQAQKGYNATALRHLVAAKDTFIEMLLCFRPASLLFSRTEAGYRNGVLLSEEKGRALFSAADVRSDALHHLSCSRTPALDLGTTDFSSAQTVCIEQDTMRQNAGILADKITRYENLVVLPMLRRSEHPPVLVFSVLPPTRRKAAGKKPRWCDSDYITTLSCMASIYAGALQMPQEQITLSQFALMLERTAEENRRLGKYVKYLKNHLPEFGAGLPLSHLCERFHEIEDADTSAEAERKTAMSAYRRRRKVIFSAAESIPGLDIIARMGFSIACTCNHDLSSFLSLFPGLTRASVDSGTPAKPFRHISSPYRMEYGEGDFVTYRSAFRYGDRLMFAENITEDVCGLIRLRAFLSVPDDGNCFLALFPREDIAEAVGLLRECVPPMRYKSVFACMYYCDEADGIRYTVPSLLESVITGKRQPETCF